MLASPGPGGSCILPMWKLQRELSCSLVMASHTASFTHSLTFHSLLHC